jgi:hypothetical protein
VVLATTTEGTRAGKILGLAYLGHGVASLHQPVALKGLITRSLLKVVRNTVEESGVQSGVVRRQVMTISNVKAMVAKVITAGLLAGAFVMMATAKAEAQAVQFGVHVGYPEYGNYRYHDDHIRREEVRRHQDWVRHDEWVRGREYHDYRGYRHDAPYRYR